MNMSMRRLHKSKTVSWASDLNLCQVKLFLSDEAPSQVGLGGQDHLQAKDSWSWHSGGSSADENLPPGFEGSQPANFLQNKLSQIPVIQWKCPSRFIVDSTWQVAAGEESKEVEVENQREMRVLEAVYPRPSAVPPNPVSIMGTDESYHNDQHTPIIPVTPIEDEDMAIDTSTSSSSVAPLTTSNVMPAPGMAPAVEPDVVTAAYSALNAAMSNTAQGNLIDPNLLIKILSDPSLIQKLVSSHGPSTSSQPISQAPPVPTTLPPAISSDPSIPAHIRPTHLPFSTSSSSSSGGTHYQPPPSSSGTHYPPPPSSSGTHYPPPPSSSSTHYPPPQSSSGTHYLPPASSSGMHYPPPSRVGPVPVSVPAPVSNMQPPSSTLPEVKPSAKKDLNYYKSLIQQHGEEKAEANNHNNSNHTNNNINNNQKTRDMKQKVMKPCIYFNSARGCRNGASCVFQHDSSSQRVNNLQDTQSAKRMKMDREITGT